MYLTTYLPYYRLHELRLFSKNATLVNAEKAALCVDYVFSQHQLDVIYKALDEVGLGGAELIWGNWQNRTSCLLRLVKYIVERGGDGLIVDSDDLLSEAFLKLDELLDLDLYHVSDVPWQHPRVRRSAYKTVELYFWKVRDDLARTMHVFADPKQAVRIKRPVVSLEAVSYVLRVVESMDPLYARVIADEITLGIVYDKSGIVEVPFVVAAKHLRHDSYPKLGHDKRLWRKIHAMALTRLYFKTGYYIPALRYAATSALYNLVLF